MTSAAHNTNNISHHLHETLPVNHHQLTSFHARATGDVTIHPQFFPENLSSEAAVQNNLLLHVGILLRERKVLSCYCNIIC